MTSRIATAILLTVWAILVAGGLTAYWVTRSVLLADLDQSLVERARSLPQVSAGAGEPAPAWPEDRYFITTDVRRIDLPAERGARGDARSLPPYTASFSTAEGRRLRTVTLHLTPHTGGAPMSGA